MKRAIPAAILAVISMCFFLLSADAISGPTCPVIKSIKKKFTVYRTKIVYIPAYRPCGFRGWRICPSYYAASTKISSTRLRPVYFSEIKCCLGWKLNKRRTECIQEDTKTTTTPSVTTTLSIPNIKISRAASKVNTSPKMASKRATLSSPTSAPSTAPAAAPKTALTATPKGTSTATASKIGSKTVCPYPFIGESNGRCYYIDHRDKVNFHNARKHCQDFGNGADLVAIETAEEYKMIQERLQTLYTKGKRIDLWTGAYRDPYTGNPIWVGTNPVTPYDLPSQIEIADDLYATEPCGAIERTTLHVTFFFFHGLKCDSNTGYICEIMTTITTPPKSVATAPYTVSATVSAKSHITATYKTATAAAPATVPITATTIAPSTTFTTATAVASGTLTAADPKTVPTPSSTTVPTVAPTTGSTNATVSCPSPFIGESNGKCYYIAKPADKVNFHHARKHCQDLGKGADLIAIETAEEYEIIKERLKTLYSKFARLYFWTGAYRDPNTGKSSWVGTDPVAPYDLPSHTNTAQDLYASEPCGAIERTMMHVTYFLFHGIECDSNSGLETGYICEILSATNALHKSSATIPNTISTTSTITTSTTATGAAPAILTTAAAKSSLISASKPTATTSFTTASSTDLIVASTTGPTNATVSCPSPFIGESNGRCYYIAKPADKVNFHHARKHCQDLGKGADLIAIETAEEYEIIKDRLETLYPKIGRVYFWTGAYRDPNTGNSSWLGTDPVAPYDLPIQTNTAQDLYASEPCGAIERTMMQVTYFLFHGIECDSDTGLETGLICEIMTATPMVTTSSMAP